MTLGPSIKSGVKLTGLKPEILLAIFIVWPVLQKHRGGKTPTITSGTEGKHKRGSEHYQGNAVDFRIWDMADPAACVEEMKLVLGENYFIQLEADHIHLHYEPLRIV